MAHNSKVPRPKLRQSPGGMGGGIGQAVDGQRKTNFSRKLTNPATPIKRSPK